MKPDWRTSSSSLQHRDRHQPLALTEQEIENLVAFLASLTSPQYSEQGATELARQR
jgi:hypothetical protein